jgi:hypothetical protein
MISDKIISCQSCTKRRPDIFMDLGHYTIIIEIDEKQHINYPCENKRLMEMFQALGNRPLICIRFNPDNYEQNNKKFNSIFKFSKTGVLIPTKFFKKRFDLLKRTLQYWLDNLPKKEITSEFLFYTS